MGLLHLLPLVCQLVFFWLFQGDVIIISRASNQEFHHKLWVFLQEQGIKMHRGQTEAISLLKNFSFAHKQNSKCIFPALVTYYLPHFISVKMSFEDPVLEKYSRHKRNSTLENCCNEMQAKLDYRLPRNRVYVLWISLNKTPSLGEDDGCVNYPRHNGWQTSSHHVPKNIANFL